MNRNIFTNTRKTRELIIDILGCTIIGIALAYGLVIYFTI